MTGLQEIMIKVNHKLVTLILYSSNCPSDVPNAITVGCVGDHLTANK